MLLFYQSAIVILGFVLYTVIQRLQDVQQKYQKLISDKQELEKLLGRYPPFESFKLFIKNFHGWLGENVPQSDLYGKDSFNTSQKMVHRFQSTKIQESKQESSKLSKQWVSFAEGEKGVDKAEGEEGEWWKLVDLVEDLKIAYVAKSSDEMQTKQPNKVQVLSQGTQIEDLNEGPSTPLQQPAQINNEQKETNNENGILPIISTDTVPATLDQYDSLEAFEKNANGNDEAKFPVVQFDKGMDISSRLIGTFLNDSVGVGPWLMSNVDVEDVTAKDIQEGGDVKMGHDVETHSQGEMSAFSWTTAVPSELGGLFERISNQYSINGADDTALQQESKVLQRSTSHAARVDSSKQPSKEMLAKPVELSKSASLKDHQTSPKAFGIAPSFGVDFGNQSVKVLEQENVSQNSQKSFGLAPTFGAEFGNNSAKNLGFDSQFQTSKNIGVDFGGYATKGEDQFQLGTQSSKKFGATPTFGAQFGNESAKHMGFTINQPDTSDSDNIQFGSSKSLGPAPTFGAEFGNESAKSLGFSIQTSKSQQSEDGNKQNASLGMQFDSKKLFGPARTFGAEFGNSQFLGFEVPQSIQEEGQGEGVQVQQIDGGVQTEGVQQQEGGFQTGEQDEVSFAVATTMTDQQQSQDEQQKSQALGAEQVQVMQAEADGGMWDLRNFHLEEDQNALTSIKEEPLKEQNQEEEEEEEAPQEQVEGKKKGLGALTMRTVFKLHNFRKRAHLRQQSKNIPEAPPAPIGRIGSVPRPPPRVGSSAGKPAVGAGGPPPRKGPAPPPPRRGMPPPPPGGRRKAAVAKYEYRKFHWIGVKRIEGTIFMDLQKIPPNIKESIKQSLWMRFIRPKAPAKEKSRATAYLEAQANRPRVLDQGHLFKIELLMEHCPEFKELRSSIFEIQPGQINLIQARTLLKLQPTDKELSDIEDNVKKYGVDVCLRPEVFYHELNKIPYLATRLKFIEAKLVHADEAPELRGWLKLIGSAADDLMDSDKFRRLLSLVLALGNLLRPKNQREKGFMMSDLIKLRDTKSFKGKSTLLHVVVHALNQHDPEVINMLDDWDALLHCKEQQLSNLQNVLGVLEEGLTFLQGVVGDDKFLESGGFEKEDVQNFYLEVANDLKELKQDFSSVREKLVALCKYLAVKIESDFDGRQPDDLFNRTLFAFGRMLQFASKEREKLQALDQPDEEYAYLDFEKDE